MAKTLERMGWKRRGGKSFLSKEELGRIEPYCWANKCKRSEIPRDSKQPFVQAKYALVDGTSKNLYDILGTMNGSTNRDGNECAALLGSRVIEVGVSVKRIR